MLIPKVGSLVHSGFSSFVLPYEHTAPGPPNGCSRWIPGNPLTASRGHSVRFAGNNPEAPQGRNWKFQNEGSPVQYGRARRGNPG